MAMKPNVFDIHAVLEGRGIPIEGVEFLPNSQTVVVMYRQKATDEQRAMGDQIAAEWDQEAENAKKEAGLKALPSIEDINAVSKLADLKAMALTLRAYIDSNS